MYLPFKYIEEVFRSRGNEIHAIVLTLPCEPSVVSTPELLSVMTGKPWAKEINSHHLFRIWIATLFYIRSLGMDSPLWSHVAAVLREEQEDVYVKYSEDKFTLAYLNVYERAIVKYLHLFKEGPGGANADGEVPPTTHYIMNMDPDHLQQMGIDTLFTHAIVRTEGDDLERYKAQHLEDQLACGVDTLYIASPP